METESILPRPNLKTEAPEKPVHVETGVGARQLDAQKNGLGIELSNMEKLEELSTRRRNKPWWLTAKSKSLWAQQLHADLSADQELRLRTFGESRGVETRIEVGLARDQRQIPFLKSVGNPFDGGETTRLNVEGKKNWTFASVEIRSEQYQVLGEIDGKNENVFAGSTLTGEKTAREQTAGFTLLTTVGELTPFVQVRSVDFDSKISPIYSNVTGSHRAGVQHRIKAFGWRFEPQISTEGFERSYSGTQTSRFRRNVLSLKNYHDARIADVEIRSHIFLQHLASTQDAIRNDQTWDVGVEISRGQGLGWVGRVRSYAIAPTPSQLFGDGGILAASPNLPPAQGLRGALGIWGKVNGWEWEISTFAERESQTPVAVAVSPVQARTIPIGGVASRGVEFNSELKIVGLKLVNRYSYQDTVNTSDIDWQRGHRIPGRPAHAALIDLSTDKQGWKQGLSYAFRSQDALDLSGLWHRPSNHNLGAYIGYGEKDWEIRIAGLHLLAAENKLPTAEFAGSAGPSLLDPTLEQTEIRFQCEILL